MKTLTKPLLAVTTVAAIASGLALAQGGVANAAEPTATPTPTSDCAVAVSLPSSPIVTTAATTTFDVTTTWTGACTTEPRKDATATYQFASFPNGTDAAAVGTSVFAGTSFVSRTLTQGTGTTSVTVPSSGLPTAGAFLGLTLTATSTKQSGATPTTVTSTTNKTAIKSSAAADIKSSRDGKSVVVVGHAYSFNGVTRVAQNAQRVRLQKLVGTEYQTVATTTTSATGRYQFSIADTGASVYRVATTATDSLVEGDSPAIASSGFTQADTKVIRLSTSKAAKKATIRGTLFVRSTVTGNFKATTGVAAELQKKVDGEWVDVKKVRSTTAGSISAVANNVHKTAYRFVVIQNSSYKTSTSTSISR